MLRDYLKIYNHKKALYKMARWVEKGDEPSSLLADSVSSGNKAEQNAIDVRDTVSPCPHKSEKQLNG